MDSTHVHLLLNHFPVIGTLIGTLMLIYGTVKKNASIQKVSLVTICMMALLAIPVFITGEPAEDSVEKLPGVMKTIIEEHEETAQIAFWAMIIAGVASLISLFMQKLQYKMSKTIILFSLFFSIITSGLMIRTGFLGGQIRHTEINKNSTVNQNNMQGTEKDDD